MQGIVTTDVLKTFSPLRLAGPIFDKELRVASRRRRTYLLRFAYIGALMFFVAQSLAVTEQISVSQSAVVQVSHMGQRASRAVITVIWFEFLLTQFLAVVLLSGSIGNEIRQRSLDVLLVTPISGLQIVLGKFASGLLQLLVLLAASLPLLAVVRVYGGVPWNYVIVSLCVILAASLFAGSLSLLMSVRNRHPYYVMLNASIICIILWASSAAVIKLLQISGHVTSSFGQTVLYLINPFYVMIVHTSEMATAASSGRIAGLWPIHCLVFLAAAGVFLLLAVYRVRRTTFVPAFRHRDKAKVDPHSPLAADATASLRVPAIRRIQGSPIVWKERRRPLFQRRRGVLGILGLIVVVGLLVALLSYLVTVGRMGLAPVCLMVAVLLHFLFILSVANSAASAVTREKEGRTLTCLLTTPLGSGSIIKDKAIGIFRQNLPLLVPVPILGLVAYQTASNLPMSVVSSVAVVFIVSILGDMILLLGLGLCLSVYLKTSVSAIVATLCGYVGARMAVGTFMAGFLRLLAPMGVLNTGLSGLAVGVVSVIAFGGLGVLFMRIAASGLRRNCL